MQVQAEEEGEEEEEGECSYRKREQCDTVVSVDDCGMMERQVISKCYSKIDTSTSQNQIKQ